MLDLVGQISRTSLIRLSWSHLVSTNPPFSHNPMLTFSYPQAILTGIYQTIDTIDRFHFSPKSIEQCTFRIPKLPKQNEPLRECKFPKFSFNMPNIFTIYKLSMWPIGIFITSTKHTHFYSCLWFYTNMIYEPSAHQRRIGVEETQRIQL